MTRTRQRAGAGLEPRELGLRALEAARTRGATEPVMLEVAELTGYADYVLIVSGRSDRQVRAIAEGVREALAAEGVRPRGREGTQLAHWVLLDYGDVVVHVFYDQVRRFYDLEGLWFEAERVELPPSPG